ncbi:hypothetical protein HD806DRAFT_547991 [Xylariaceae sp. AK1471]|nr:hypothetical protein HD806DRAFT_547991 [Xylariaceae sp. AK1471]
MADSNVSQPRHMAWNAKEDEINNFFRSAWTNGNIHVAHLTSPHGTGKSTSLIKHIVSLKTSLDADTTIVYAGTNQPDLSRAQKYFAQTDTLAMTVTRTSLLDNMPSMPKITWLVDLETLPSEDGEIALGKILAASKSHPVATDDDGTEKNTVIVTLGSFRDKAVEQCFARFLQVEATVMTIAETEPLISLLPLDIEQLRGVLKHDTLMTDQEKDTAQEKVGLSLVIPGGDDLVTMPTDLDEIGCYVDWITDITDMRGVESTLQKVPLVIINPKIVDFSTSTDRLRRCITDCIKTATYTDMATSQLMKGPRRLTKLEFMDQLGWVWKTRANRSAIDVYAPNFMIDLMQPTESQTGVDELSGWSGDLMIYLLHLFSTWTGWSIPKMPVRVIPLPMRPVIAEYITRLQFLGCLYEDTNAPVPGAFAPMGRTHTVLYLRGCLGKDMDFHTAYFLAAADGEEFRSRPNVQRVMIRIAALIMTGIRKFMYLKFDLDQAHQYATKVLCAGVGADRSHRGAVWLALGIWQRLLVQNQFSIRVVDVLEEPELSVKRLQGQSVLAVVKMLEEVFEVPEASDELDATKLTKEELTMIDKEMMRAWLHRMVFIKSESLEAVEVVSTTVIATSSASANLPLRHTAEAYDRIGEKGFFGFYTEIQEIQETEPRQYQCENITVIDTPLFADVGPYFTTIVTNPQRQ